MTKCRKVSHCFGCKFILPRSLVSSMALFFGSFFMLEGEQTVPLPA